MPAFVLTDAYVQLSPADSASRLARRLRPALVIGQFRTPFSLEYLTPFSAILTANRSLAADRLAARRDIGVMAQVRLAPLGTLSAAVVNGEGPNRTTNPDGKQMVVGRLTLRPFRGASVSAKALGQGGDRRWGYDARWTGRGAAIEGEVVRRARGAGTTAPPDASAGYVLVAYKPLPWLQPVVKWKRLREKPATGSGGTGSTLTWWATYGINLLGPEGRFRLQVNWILKTERPAERSDELVAQFQATF